jgi:hypothetical protein
MLPTSKADPAKVRATMQSQAIAEVALRATKPRKRITLLRFLPLGIPLLYLCLAITTVFADPTIGERVTKAETQIETQTAATNTNTGDLKTLNNIVTTMAAEFKAQRDYDQRKWDYISEVSKMLVGGLLLQLIFTAWEVKKRVTIWAAQRGEKDVE